MVVDARLQKTSVWRDGQKLGNCPIKADPAGEQLLMLGDFTSDLEDDSKETLMDYFRWIPLPSLDRQVPEPDICQTRMIC